MFEWSVDSALLAPVLEDAVALARTGPQSREASSCAVHALVVGCGTSALSSELWNNGRGCRVHSVDIEADAIATMRDKHPDCDGLTWQVLDLVAAGSLAATADERLEPEAFDLAVDKATLDYFLCGEPSTSADVLNAVHGSLAEGGVLLVVSIHPLPLLRALLLGCPAIGFEEIRSWALDAAGSEVDVASAIYGALALRRKRRDWNAEARASVMAHLSQALDVHFAREVPLLTEERELALRDAWRESTCGGMARLPAAKAHEVMFPSFSERSEYTLEYFLEDLRDGQPEESACADSASLSLEQALDFLRKNQ